MEKFIPLEKMSKKKQRKFYKAQRRSWGGISPVTRREKDPKVYNRAKEKRDCDYRGHADLLKPVFTSVCAHLFGKFCRRLP
ncbi:MAG: hypothetical protein ACI4JF_09185 [Oscillospiraceae bacterium]